MSWSVTLAGQTFTDANVEGTAYADEQSGFPAIIAAIADETKFLKGIGATSFDTVTPAVGTIAMTTNEPNGQVSLPVGALIQVADISGGSNFMIGTVTSFNGTALVFEATIASGVAGDNWIIGYPVSRMSSLSEDLATNGFNITSVDNGDVSIAPDGTGLTRIKNLAATGTATFGGDVSIGGETLFQSGEQWSGQDLGTASTDFTISPSDDQFLWAVCAADLVIELAAPAAGYGYAKVLKLSQDATGGRLIQIRRSIDQVNAIWITDPVDWANRPADIWDYLSIVYTPAGDLLVGHIAGTV